MVVTNPDGTSTFEANIPGSLPADKGPIKGSLTTAKGTEHGLLSPTGEGVGTFIPDSANQEPGSSIFHYRRPL